MADRKVVERPILMSAPMVRALLEDRKTQTRRIAKLYPSADGKRFIVTSPDESLIELEDGEFRRGICHYASTAALSGPYNLGYAVGERRWVRETLKQHDDGCWYYAADDVPILLRQSDPRCSQMIAWAHHKDDASTCVSIHMPRFASRITFEITDVRVQRLQEISYGDAIAEGIDSVPSVAKPGARAWCDYNIPHDPFEWFDSPIYSYRSLWEKINGAGSWDADPWIVALTFKRVESEVHGS